MDILDKNGIIQILAHCMVSSVSLSDGKIENPFVLSNHEHWTNNNYLFDNSKARQIKLINEKIKSMDYETDFIDIFLADGTKTVTFIKAEYIEKAIKELFPNEINDLLEVIPSDTVNQLAKYFIDNKVIGDMYMNIFREISKSFDITYCGALYPKKITETSKEISVSGDDSDIETIQYLLSCPFHIYYEHIRKFDKKLVEDVVVAKECKFFYNENLPTPYIPILADKVLVGQNGKPIRPSYWQMYVNYNMLGHKASLITAGRQSGKTYNSIRMAFMRIMQKEKCDIVYVCMTEDLFFQPWNYFEWALKRGQDYGIFSLKNTTNEIVCNVTGNKIKFVSANSKMGVRSYKFNTIIVDEASYIKDDVYLDFIPIVKNNDSEMICNTTISWKAKANSTEWYYQLLSGTEFGLYGDKNFSIRVNIDQVEWLDQDNVRDLKLSLKNNLERYYCELYAMLPSSNDGIFPEGFFRLGTHKFNSEHKYLVAWDLAKKFDTAGIVVLDQTDGCIVEERRLANTTYADQIKIIKSLKEFYNARCAADISNEEGILEFYPGVIDYPVHFTSGKTFNQKFVFGQTRWYIGKENLVTNFMNLAENGDLRGFVSLTLLQMEAENYKKKTTKSGNAKYEAQSGTDDLVSAALVAAFVYNETYLKPLARYKKLTSKKKVDEYELQKRRINELKIKKANDRRFKKFVI